MCPVLFCFDLGFASRTASRSGAVLFFSSSFSALHVLVPCLARDHVVTTILFVFMSYHKRERFNTNNDQELSTCLPNVLCTHNTAAAAALRRQSKVKLTHPSIHPSHV